MRAAKAMENLTASPCCNPELSLAEALGAYSVLGFRNFEIFAGWTGAAYDVEKGPQFYLELGRKYGMKFTSVHLPPVLADDFEGTMEMALAAAGFADGLGAEVVLFKARSREVYIRAAGTFLDATQYLSVTPVLTNHAGTAISTLDDFREVLDGIADDRMKTCLEVGHFHSVGVSWREGCELLGESIALVHIKDQIAKQSVPFGTGEIDLGGLFEHMRSVGYGGKFVVEMEVADKANTLKYLAHAVEYLKGNCL